MAPLPACHRRRFLQLGRVSILPHLMPRSSMFWRLMKIPRDAEKYLQRHASLSVKYRLPPVDPDDDPVIVRVVKHNIRISYGAVFIGPLVNTFLRLVLFTMASESVGRFLRQVVSGTSEPYEPYVRGLMGAVGSKSDRYRLDPREALSLAFTAYQVTVSTGFRLSSRHVGAYFTITFVVFVVVTY